MATAINNGDIRALLDSVNQLTQQVANMGQQITNLQHQRQPGYFYPNMPMSWGIGDVIDREGEVYCRGVYGFTDRLKIATQSRNVNFVKNLSQNMETYFRGEALHWWNDELDALTRRGLLYADNMNEWSEILQKRFKTPFDHGTFVRNHLALGQNPLQEPTKSPEPIQLPTPLLLTQQQYEPGKPRPDPSSRWHKDLPPLAPRSSTAYAATEDASAATEISLEGIPKELFAEGFHQGAQWAQTYDSTEPDVEPESFNEELDDHESFDTMASVYISNICHLDFSSNNKLHAHIRDHSENASPVDLPFEIPSSEGPDQESSKGYQGVQWAQTYNTTKPDVEPENFDDEFEDESFNSTASEYTCSICHSDFGSNDKLHIYIRAHSEDDSVQTEAYIATPMNLPLIESTASPTHTYAAAQTSLTVHGITETICLDTGSTIKLIDKEFLLRQDPDVDIYKRQTEITVRGFGSSRYRVSEYIL